MFTGPKNVFRAAAEYQPMLRMIGLDADGVFTDPRIVSWRSLPDRQNCTLDADLGDGWKVRLHVKRYFPRRGATPAEDEARGYRALVYEKIPTAPLVGWGELDDGRSFTVFEDLDGFTPADKLVESGVPFERLLGATADLAARLHKAGLHHRDFYLCHFMARLHADDEARPELKLIDTARVRRLPGFLTRRRWIVKDLAQFWYSTTKLSVTDAQRSQWLARYAAGRALDEPSIVGTLRRAIERKVDRIARHDQNLRLAQPARNISIPQAPRAK